MKRLCSSSLFAVFVVTCALAVMPACASAAAHAPVQHPDIIECGGPMAEAAAERAAVVAYDLVAKGAPVEQLEQAIVAELKTLAVKHGPDLVACLVDKALNAHRSPLALQRRLYLVAPSSEVEQLAGVGFVPIARDLSHVRPWHTTLAGARGSRS